MGIMKRRMVTLLLCLLMVVSFFPATALAASMDDVPKSIGAPVNVGIEAKVDDGVLWGFQGFQTSGEQEEI